MMYLYNTASAKIVGIFGEYSLVEDYFIDHLIVDRSEFILLTEVSEMTYISKICYADGELIYNNATFWKTVAPQIYTDFGNHVILDWMSRPVSELEFKNEFKANLARVSNVVTRADEVAYNIKIGAEFIALFREECITVDIGGQNGLSIASALSNVIPLIQTGSFQEAAYVIAHMTRNDFLTDARLNRYMNMLLVSDIITYT